MKKHEYIAPSSTLNRMDAELLQANKLSGDSVKNAANDDDMQTSLFAIDDGFGGDDDNIQASNGSALWDD